MTGRLVSSAVLIPGFVLLCWLDHRSGPAAVPLFLGVLGVALKATHELTRLFPPPAAPGHPDPESPPDYWADPEAARPSLLAAAAGVALVLLAAWVPHWLLRTVPPALPPTNPVTGLGFVAAAMAAGCVLATVRRVLRFDRPGGHAAGLAAECLAVLYVGGLLAATAQLRWLDRGEAGYLAIGSLIAAAKCGDTGAYLTGRAFGRRKMIPAVSPGKTWAGAAGAVAWAAGGVCLWLWLAGPAFGRPAVIWPRAVAFGAVVGLAGLLGDLVESVLKRDAGVKDAGSLLPGMGGVLDVLDSLLIAGPLAALLWFTWPPAV